MSWSRTKHLWSFSLLLCWLSWTCMCNSAVEVGRRAARLEEEFKSLKRATRYPEGPCSTAERPPEKKQLRECTIKVWNSERHWMELYNKMAFEQIQAMFLWMWYQAFRWLFRVAIQLELLSDPKWPLRTRQEKDGKRKTKIMRRSQP